MDSEVAPHQLRMFFFPYMAAGHMIPMLDVAKLFACRGVASTIITTPLILLLSPLPSNEPTPIPSPSSASLSLLLPTQASPTAWKPDCLISDMFLPWTADIAHELGIPRLIFDGMRFFSLCVLHLLEHYRPQDNVSGNDDPFIVPGLPHPIEMARS